MKWWQSARSWKEYERKLNGQVKEWISDRMTCQRDDSPVAERGSQRHKKFQADRMHEGISWARRREMSDAMRLYYVSHIGFDLQPLVSNLDHQWSLRSRSFYGALNVVLMLVTVVSVILRDFIVGSVTVAVPNRGYGAKPPNNEKRRG